MDNNLKSTQRYLVLMRIFLSEAKGSVLNERQRVWMDQLRAVSQKGQSLIDPEYPKGKGGCLSKTKYATYINSLLKEILDISDRKVMYGIANIIQGTPIHIQESEIESDHDDNSVTATSHRPVTGLKETVQSITGEKELMEAMLVDAENMGELDGRSKIWVDQLRAISLEAQSVISKYDVKLKHKTVLIHIFKYWTRYVISKKIDDVKNKIEDASRRKRAYGFVQIQSRAELSSSTVQILRGRTKPSLVAKESSVVGFDDDTQVLKAQLLSDEKHRCITWIVGIKGTGKRTLAKLIFEDSAVVGHFDYRLRVSLSTSNLTAPQLLEEISKEAENQKNWESSSKPVLETLALSKYLIVIDGIEENYQVYLETLKDAIPDKSTSSRFLLTTCNANVARHVVGTNTFVHPLQLLDDESSWVMFTRHLKAWSSVLGGDQFKQDQIQSWSKTLDAVKTNLPSYLRRCLFYFVLFPSEFGIPVRRLVVLWAAEGLIHRTEEVLTELVAERYLTELIDRNMVQVAKRKRNGKVKTCRIPSALRQLWLTKPNQSIFLRQRSTAIGTDSNADPKTSIIRRVADNLDQDDIWNDHIHSGSTNSTTLKSYYKDVLSFLSFDTQEGSKPGQQVGNFLKGCISSDCFLLLRVLDLECVYKPKLPKRIKRLTRLRYLGLRWTYLESLPSSISKLLKLQTLDLKHTYIHTLPTSIWKMELRHLFLSETYRTKFPSQPKGNSLSDLQTLWGLFVDEETPVEDGLDRLVNITRLGLACQSMSLNQEAMIAKLETVANWIMKLKHLQSLRLKSRDEEGRPWDLNLKSFENNVNLTDMYLLGSLSSSSVLLSQFPRSLIELTLSHSKLQDDPMKVLKNFPNLQILCLLAESYTGTTMVCESQSFPQLHVLNIWLLEQLQEWEIEGGALPCLRQLEIRSCRNLQRIPDGLKHVNTLLELKFTNMPQEINTEPDNFPPNCQVVRE
ncbi:hypothetical protein P8452_09705 [Trifolium repens]|nr:hypothetical protein P8452_09705 [Trifolium repens]